MRATRPQLLVVLSLLAAGTARADWIRSPAAGNLAPNHALHGVAMVSPTEVWAVGGVTNTAAFIVQSTSGFRSAASTSVVGGHGLLRALQAVCVPPGTTDVHALGDRNTRASRINGTWFYDTSAAFQVGDTITTQVLACIGGGQIYVGGQTSLMEPFLGLWTPTAGTDKVSANLLTSTYMFSVPALGLDPSGSGLIAFGVRELFPVPLPEPLDAPLYTAAADITSIGFAGGVGVAVTATNPLRLAGSVVTPVTGSGWTAMQAVHLRPDGFAVAVGASGEVAESTDFGQSWTIVAAPLAGKANLRAVTCWDSKRCVAVGEAGELLFRNEGPTATITTTLGSLTIDDGSSFCFLEQAATDPEGDPIDWRLWTYEGSTTSGAPCSTVGNLCSDESRPVRLELGDAWSSTAIDDLLIVRAQPRAPSVTSAVAPGSIGEGETKTASVAAAHACAVDYAWSCPALATAGQATSYAGPAVDFTGPADLCDDLPVSCAVTVSAQGSTTSHPVTVQDLAFTYTATPRAPALAVASPGTLAPGQSAALTAAATHPCALDYEWSCPALTALGQAATRTGATANFTNPGGLCVPVPVQCTVTATSSSSSIAHPAASTTVDFVYDAAPVAPAVAPIAPPGPIAEAQSKTVTVTATHACGVTLDWSCPALATVGQAATFQGASHTFTHPGGLCADVPVLCTITASAPGHPTATATLEFTYVAAAVAPVVGSSAPGVLAEGQTGSATITAAHPCALDYAWSCPALATVLQPTSYTGTSAGFSNPGALCDDVLVDCTVTVSPVGSATAHPAATHSVAFTYAASPVAPALQPLTSPGTLAADQLVSLTASAAHPCAVAYTWSCPALAAAGQPTTRSGATTSFTNPGDFCAPLPVVCTVTASSTGSSVAHPSASTTVDFTYDPRPVVPVFSSISPPGPVTNGQSKTVSVSATHPCGLAYDWSCPALATVGQAASFQGASHTFTHPGGLCADVPVHCTITASAPGHPTATATLDFTYVAAPVAPTVASVTAPGAIADGLSAPASIAASHPCALDYAWSCPALEPASYSGASVDFGNPGGHCDDVPVTCTVTVTALGSTTAHPAASRSVSFSLLATPAAPTLEAIASPGALAPSQTASVTATATHACPVTYSWSCPALAAVGQSASRAGATASFSNPGNLCDSVPVQCTVTAAASGSSLPHPTASRTVDFTYDAPKVAPVFAAMPAPGSLAPETPTPVTVAATHACPLEYAWTCDTLAQVEPLHPLAPGPTQTFTNPGRLCASVPVSCTVTAIPGHGHPSASGTLAYSYAASLFAPAWTLQYSDGSAIGEGASTTATVVPQHCSGATFDFRWSNCSPGVTAPADGAPSVTYAHPGPAPFFCEPKTASCQVVVRTSVAGQAHPDTAAIDVPVTFAPAFADAQNLFLQASGGQRPRDAVSVLATNDAECGAVVDGYSWTAAMRSRPDEVLATAGGSATFSFSLPDACGKDTAVVTLTDSRSGLQSTAELPFDSGADLPTIADASAADYLPSAEPQLDCAAPEPLVIRPRVQPACPGEIRYAWSQLSGPALAFATRPSGELEAPISPADLAALAGQTVQYRLEVTDAAGTSGPRDYTVRFLPRPYLDLGHVADRAVATPGERVAFAVKLHNGCRAAVGPVDVHVRLAGLEYLPGSARLDDASLPDPRITGEALVFPAVPVREAGQSAPVLSYAARRSALGGGQASAEAAAYLSAAPELQVSRAVRAGEGSLEGGLGAVACGCGAAGSPALGALAGLAALLWRRRRRG